ncbi:restriction endonuclease subunit S [Blautia sp. MSJ-19]|uniref:restriction endonuclease subunit S n=1 Tax=Blautia sp. MSJ-19 TaxID=2841517 RepID=UPI001C0EA6A7|nr:restriction endonuclease subunit S [Blautia sp. MSJ-19]MBU5480056.1 restriction endonuclease subunit S [Blautia sp. MSJ-19]
MKVKIENLTKIKTGKLDANASSEDGRYPFFTCSREPLKISTYSYDCECVLVAGNGDLNVKYYNGKFDAYQRTYIIEDNGSGKLYMPYLYYFMEGYIEELRKQAIGGVIKYIKLRNLTDALIKLPSIDEQKTIAYILEKTSQLLEMRKKEINSLDNLIKARFVEMFGDLANPECLWGKSKLVDVCADKDDIKCGPFGTQLNKDEYVESGIAVWEIPQINAAFLTKPTHFLTEEKAEQLKAYTIIPGDIAMSRKGNVGKCALFPNNYQKGIIHSDVLRIRVDCKRVNPLFIMCQLHFSGAVTRQIELVSSGAIMAGVNVTKLKQIYIHVPPIELQNQFADFVCAIDKSKVAVQKALDETQKLFDSLMQQYFG